MENNVKIYSPVLYYAIQAAKAQLKNYELRITLRSN